MKWLFLTNGDNSVTNPILTKNRNRCTSLRAMDYGLNIVVPTREFESFNLEFTHVHQGSLNITKPNQGLCFLACFNVYPTSFEITAFHCTTSQECHRT